ncbi:hypothetical protein Moror_2654 [Moniliophthora roreri MCA 2997]|uniref:Uncharacterized protein n=1 Tax=Moniliophthora roreri (strain MCA 2997) TaxID=1381753 RepID=V2XF44_MONRO|nr:hypothetical protein Moror_2654 [Moniliophthora roreri MCA 2997]
MLASVSSVFSLASVNGLVLSELEQIAEVVDLRNQNAIFDAFHFGSQYVEAPVTFSASRTYKKLTAAFQTDVFESESFNDASVVEVDGKVAVVEDVIATNHQQLEPLKPALLKWIGNSNITPATPPRKKKTTIPNLWTATTTTPPRPSRAQKENTKPTPTTFNVNDSRTKAEKRKRRIVSGDLLAVMLRPQATPWTV